MEHAQFIFLYMFPHVGGGLFML